jgi:hypothetical protein
MQLPPSPAEAEEMLRRLLEEGGLPPPDEVQHQPAEMTFLYHEQKLAFVFELTPRNESISHVMDMRYCASHESDDSNP